MNTDMFKRLLLKSDLVVTLSTPEIVLKTINEEEQYTPEMRRLLLLNLETDENLDLTDQLDTDSSDDD